MGNADFDFLFGRWTVQHEKLTDPLDPECDTWDRFTTETEAQGILGGTGNSDETRGTLPDGTAFTGYSLRLYAPELDRWSIWWASTMRPGVLDDPVHGRFADGVGTFVGEDERNGVRFLQRFRWRDTNTDNPVWEQ